MKRLPAYRNNSRARVWKDESPAHIRTGTVKMA